MTEYREARSIVLHGVDADEARRYLAKVAEQGKPTINRATRRKSQRVGDRARKAAKRRAGQ